MSKAKTEQNQPRNHNYLNQVFDSNENDQSEFDSRSQHPEHSRPGVSGVSLSPNPRYTFRADTPSSTRTNCDRRQSISTISTTSPRSSFRSSVASTVIPTNSECSKLMKNYKYWLLVVTAILLTAAILLAVFFVIFNKSYLDEKVDLKRNETVEKQDRIFLQSEQRNGLDKIFSGSLRILNDQFTVELADMNSAAFRTKSTEYQIKIKNVFAATVYSTALKTVAITKFSSGSLLVEFQLAFTGKTQQVSAAPCQILITDAARRHAVPDSPFYNTIVDVLSIIVKSPPTTTPPFVVTTAGPTTTTTTATTNTTVGNNPTPVPVVTNGSTSATSTSTPTTTSTSTTTSTPTTTSTSTTTTSTTTTSTTTTSTTTTSTPTTTFVGTTTTGDGTQSQSVTGNTTTPTSPTSTTSISSSTISESSSCKNEMLPYCADMPWQSVKYPTLLGHTSSAEANAALSFFQIMEILQCHPDVHNFTCYLLQTPCSLNGTDVKPMCRSFCESIMETCSKYFSQTAYGKRFTCSQFDWEANATQCYQACSPKSFTCKDTGFCIPEASRCNSIFDCGPKDKTDEINCTCDPTTHFKCSNGVCIEKARHCNNFNDCGEWQDEQNCTCRTGMQQCATTGQCFYKSAWCDYKFDCGDRSDEAGCDCKPFDYMCQGGYCQESDARCNGVNDCGDFSDEYDCQCDSTEYRCDKFLCKSYLQTWCNKRPDCNDKTDEPFNCTCKDYQYKCKSGQCIPIFEACDGTPNCDDNSDEYNCECTKYELGCGDGSCVPRRYVCDGKQHCSNMADEQNCTCADGYFKCSNGLCVDVAYWCDGSNDCADGGDEKTGCKEECPPGHPLKCSLITTLQTVCLAQRHVCDGIVDCSLMEDEKGCQCNVSTQFRCNDGYCKPWSAFCNGVVDCIDKSDETLGCVCDKATQTECLNGLCYAKTGRCDGIRDCADFTDEKNCDCAQKMNHTMPDRLCDGTLDCPDFSDEQACPNCTTDSFICGKKCLPPLQVCDGIIHCDNGEDEKLCLRLVPKNTSIPTDFWDFKPKGILYGRQGSAWYKICAENFQTETVEELSKFGERICSSKMHYKNLIDISVIKDDSVSMYLSLLETNNLDAIKASASFCLSRQIISIECSNIECGVRPLPHIPRSRIVGGESARAGKWPWYAAIFKNGEQWCGSTIIHPQWVLSAAHCFDSHALQSDEPPRASWDQDFKPSRHLFESLQDDMRQNLSFAQRNPTVKIMVRAGIFRKDTRSPFDQFRLATHIIIHSNYNPKTGWNDIALVHLDRPLDYGAYVMPACIPEKFSNVPPNAKCWIVGLGGIQWQIEGPNELQEVQIPVMDWEKCRKYATINFENKIINTQICGGYAEGGKDTCQGDSGGPLFCEGADGRWTSIGVVSRGYKCAKAQTPGIYTKVSMYIEWIDNIIGKEPIGEATPPCLLTQYECLLGTCLNKTVDCDGTVDCSLGEDEYKCIGTTTIPFGTTIPPLPGTTLKPLGTTLRPVGTTLKPLGTTLKPLGTTLKPLGTTLKPLGTTLKPLGTTLKPLGTTLKPLGTTLKPLGTTLKPLGTTLKPLGTTLKPLGTTLKPLGTTLKPIGTTLKPLGTTGIFTLKPGLPTTPLFTIVGTTLAPLKPLLDRPSVKENPQSTSDVGNPLLDLAREIGDSTEGTETSRAHNHATSTSSSTSLKFIDSVSVIEESTSQPTSFNHRTASIASVAISMPSLDSTISNTSVDVNVLSSPTSSAVLLQSCASSIIGCRICLESKNPGLIHPCSCRGTMGTVHSECLVRWLETSGKISCEFCKTKYLMRKRVKKIALWRRPESFRILPFLDFLSKLMVLIVIIIYDVHLVAETIDTVERFNQLSHLYNQNSQLYRQNDVILRDSMNHWFENTTSDYCCLLELVCGAYPKFLSSRDKYALRKILAYKLLEGSNKDVITSQLYHNVPLCTEKTEDELRELSTNKNAVCTIIQEKHPHKCDHIDKNNKESLESMKWSKTSKLKLADQLQLLRSKMFDKGFELIFKFTIGFLTIIFEFICLSMIISYAKRQVNDWIIHNTAIEIITPIVNDDNDSNDGGPSSLIEDTEVKVTEIGPQQHGDPSQIQEQFSQPVTCYPTQPAMPSFPAEQLNQHNQAQGHPNAPDEEQPQRAMNQENYHQRQRQVTIQPPDDVGRTTGAMQNGNFYSNEEATERFRQMAPPLEGYTGIIPPHKRQQIMELQARIAMDEQRKEAERDAAKRAKHISKQGGAHAGSQGPPAAGYTGHRPGLNQQHGKNSNDIMMQQQGQGPNDDDHYRKAPPLAGYTGHVPVHRQDPATGVQRPAEQSERGMGQGSESDQKTAYYRNGPPLAGYTGKYPNEYEQQIIMQKRQQNGI